MKIARPPDGFKIVIRERAQSALEAARSHVQRLDEIWDGVCQRLKITAHREGEPLPNGDLVIQFPGNLAFGIPTLAVCYSVLGDTVTIKRVLVGL